MHTRAHVKVLASLANFSIDSRSDDILIRRGITEFDSVFLFVVLLTSLIANGFLVSKIITDRRLQTSINLLLMIHNVLNILLCLTTLLPATILITANIKSLHPILCQVNASSYLLLHYLSIANLSCIAIDRWRTISNTKYKLEAKDIVKTQIIHLATAAILCLPWSYFLNKRNSVVEFSQGLLKCRVVHETWQEHTALLICIVAIRFLLFILVPVVIISFCFTKIFQKVRGHWNSVGPAIQASDGIPVGCYLKSSFTNTFLVSSFVLLRFPELIYVNVDSSRHVSSSGDVYAKRFVAYSSWVETSIFPFVCIMRNTTLLRQVTSMAFCNFFMNLLSRKKDRRRRPYEVTTSQNSYRCMLTSTRGSLEAGVSMPSSSISTLRSGSPSWSKASASIKDAWTVSETNSVTAF